MKKQLSVLNVVVSEFGKMVFDVRLGERFSDIFVGTVPFGFHARKVFHARVILPFFLLKVSLR